MGRKLDGDAFDFEITADGSFEDEGVNIRTIIIRLNGVAMNDWIMSKVLNDRYVYDTQEEWEDHKAKHAAMLNAWERKILDKLKFTSDTGYSITKSVSEIFTVVLFEKV